MKSSNTTLTQLLARDEQAILADWTRQQLASITIRADLMTESELRQQSQKFLAALRSALDRNAGTDIHGAQWSEVRELLGQVSASRAQQGFSPSETATFIFSLKEPLFTRL